MKLTFAGTGSAFCTAADNFQSNMILETSNTETGQLARLLIDCGTDARHALHRLGLWPKDFEAIYVSHLHSDHIGGLEWIALSNYFIFHRHRIDLYVVNELIDPLWEHSLRGGLEVSDHGNSTLETYFNVKPLQPEGSFNWHDVNLEVLPVDHIVAKNGKMQSFALFGTTNSTRFFITTDAIFNPDAHMAYYRKADVIYQDCELGPRWSGVHAHYDQLKTLPDDIKAKMWLYHYPAYAKPDAVADGFCGFVTPGQSFDLA
ncbi:MBL fold metallo-hydrolase [Thalassospira mesophila]|uniref:Uncharacterized protein n=1 Tax=Thalassospira mesophila TaxID=1293891 RepID=A0A1Y2L3X6_9PROT|nr:MBL fold metallo-hydrolase [Thalassospira mesophila]OSQ39532.1 hypothetical protein TMES_05780 [Thalassospira mesophila]